MTERRVPVNPLTILVAVALAGLFIGIGGGIESAVETHPKAVAAAPASPPAKPAIGRPGHNARSWVDAFGRNCTQVNPQGGAIALDCDYPPAAADNEGRS